MYSHQQKILLVRGTGRRILACLAYNNYDVRQRLSIDTIVHYLKDFSDKEEVCERLVELSLGQLARLGFLTCRSSVSGSYVVTEGGKAAAHEVLARAKRGDVDFAQMIPPSLRHRATPQPVTGKAVSNPLTTEAKLGVRWRPA